jgi:hypothetical protein
MFDWKKNLRNKRQRGNQTPGRTKGPACQTNWKKKFLAKRSRSYKTAMYLDWDKVFSK